MNYRHPVLASTGYHLVAITDGVVTSVDGPHSDPGGVAKALKLYKGLGFFKADAVYRMVLVAEVPEDAPHEPINVEAMETMGALVRRSREEA